MAENQVLLGSKQNEVIRLAEGTGLDRKSFKFHEKTFRTFNAISGRPEGSFICSVLSHVDGYFFEFNYNGSLYDPIYSPGISATTEEDYALEWNEVLEKVNLWLSLIKKELDTSRFSTPGVGMDDIGNWTILERIDSGGQGEVFHVIPKEYDLSSEEIEREFIKSIGLHHDMKPDSEENVISRFAALKDLISKSIGFEKEKNKYALKRLFKPENDPDFEKAKTRLKREIEAMGSNLHPNLMKIEDYDTDYLWYVMKFYQNGTLAGSLEKYKGNLLRTLTDFRPLVEAVSVLHKNGCFHRDIKPENVFIDDAGMLILGDFGLVFRPDSNENRITATFEKAGSHPWMPSWAYDKRLEDVNPSFDVFCLGKLLWAMLLGEKRVPLWYINEEGYEQYNLELQFPNLSSISLFLPFLQKCVVQHEKDCLIKNADEMLKHIDLLIAGVTVNAEHIGAKMTMRCKACGIGKYGLLVYDNYTETRDYGFHQVGNKFFRIMACNHCGNTQLFLAEVGKNDTFKAWSNE